MDAVGIVAEYNPLHNGHVYHLNETKRIAGSDAVVVAMSGNFVQRGEPAIVDKWARAEAAVRTGANLVVEIPCLFCVGNAGQYASAGVALLEALGPVNKISFGSECGDVEALKRVASNLKIYNDDIDNSIGQSIGLGLSYPAAREKAYAELFSQSKYATEYIKEHINYDLKLLSSSNDILGIEYIKACNRLSPIIVQRKGSRYDFAELTEGEYPSAKALRRYLFSDFDEVGESRDYSILSAFVPSFTQSIIQNNYLVNPEHCFKLLKYAIISMTAKEIELCPSAGEGLGNKLRSCIDKCNSLDELISQVKSKRYTYTRISRLCMQILLGITIENYCSLKPSYIRILAMDETGRKLLSQIKKEESCSLPIICNYAKDSALLNEEGKLLADLDVHASDIYNLIAGNDIYSCSDYRKHPTIIG